MPPSRLPRSDLSQPDRVIDHWHRFNRDSIFLPHLSLFFITSGHMHPYMFPILGLVPIANTRDESSAWTGFWILGQETYRLFVQLR